MIRSEVYLVSGGSQALTSKEVLCLPKRVIPRIDCCYSYSAKEANKLREAAANQVRALSLLEVPVMSAKHLDLD